MSEVNIPQQKQYQAPSKPVRPRHAASLVLCRHSGNQMEVLLGRREPRHRFMPNVYVFPGGRLDRQDYHTRPRTPLPVATETKLSAHCRPSMARALAIAALRETFEETGLALGGVRTGATALHLSPDLHGLHFLARAITPPDSPIRFHARFFLAELPPDAAELAGNGELLDLKWVELEAALELPVVDVTQFVLQETMRHFDGRQDADVPLFHYYRGRAHILRGNRRIPVD